MNFVRKTTLKLASASAFNLDQSEILLFSKELILSEHCFSHVLVPNASICNHTLLVSSAVAMYKFFLNPLPDNRILDWSKLKQIAGDILKCI